MSDLKGTTISARVTPRVRRLVEVAAEAKGITLSRFVADTVEEKAVRSIAGTDTSPSDRADRAKKEDDE